VAEPVETYHSTAEIALGKGPEPFNRVELAGIRSVVDNFDLTSFAKIDHFASAVDTQVVEHEYDGGAPRVLI
jgi:hypothetical protein